jgi:hypothetical protein
MKSYLWTLSVVVCGLLAPCLSKAQLSAEEQAKANNPLASVKAFNLQNYYIPSVYEDANLKANSMLIRYGTPFDKGKILVRFTLPLSTTPSGYDGTGHPTYSSGMGDLNFFATYTFSKPGAKTLLGIGPQVVIPTGSNNFTGSGKWQIGGAIVAFNMASPALQYGALITYQTSIAGQSDRPSASQLVVQPVGIFQLGKGAYLRSSALWSFNLQNSSYTVPFGVGVGHLMKAGAAIFNLFIEPQFTILHEGSGQPALQVFGGINCQF